MDTAVPPELPEKYKRTPEFYTQKGISFTEGSWCNSKGFRLFTTTWVPLSQPSKGLVFICHGYGVDCSTFFRDTAEGIAAGGYTVYGLDNQGFGQSEGLRGMISSLDDIVDDCLAYYSPIRDAPENAPLPKFLCGESMGGAILLKMHLREPTAWQGGVLMAPMCKIADEMRPAPAVEWVLRQLAWVLPTWAIVPTQDLGDAANEDPAKRVYYRDHPMIYHGKPRLGSALAMLGATEELANRLHEVSLPFIVLHGDADTITDPKISQALFDCACSKDKTFKLYPGMWHSLTQGAMPENAAIVFADIISWLDERRK